MYKNCAALLGLFLTIAPASAQSSKWKGKIEHENGVKVVVNPAEPMFGEIILDIENDLTIGSEEDEDHAFYKGVSIALDRAGDIYVADSGNHRIQKFDPEGKLLQSIGRKGQGPGEFEHLSGVAIDSSFNIYAKDGFTIDIFDRTGSFKRTIALGTSIIRWGVTFEENVFGVAFSHSPQGLSWKLLLFRSDSRAPKTIKACEPHNYGPFMFDGVAVGGFNYLAPKLVYCSSGDRQGLYAYSDRYRLYLIDAEGSTVKIISREAVPEEITDKEKEIILDTEISEALRRSGKKLSKHGLKTQYEFPDKKPAFSNIRMDETGNIYVFRLTNAALETKLFECDFYNSEGYILHTLKFSAVSPRVIRNGTIYEVKPDKESGYLYVRRYKIKNWDLLKTGIN